MLEFLKCPWLTCGGSNLIEVRVFLFPMDAFMIHFLFLRVVVALRFSRYEGDVTQFNINIMSMRLLCEFIVLLYKKIYLHVSSLLFWLAVRTIYCKRAKKTPNTKGLIFIYSLFVHTHVENFFFLYVNLHYFNKVQLKCHF